MTRSGSITSSRRTRPPSRASACTLPDRRDHSRTEKKLRVCSDQAISADARPSLVANTNVQFAEKVKREAGIATRTVGLIAAPKQAEAIVAEGKADMVALARAMLDDPHWGWRAAHVLGAEVVRPNQYQRASPKVWAGAAFRD